MNELRCLKLEIEYDGTTFAGFQKQKGEITIQGALEEAVGKICGERASVIGAGRTDAGVHALAQVCHFRTASPISCASLAKGLNAILRPCIVVRAIREVPENFHARLSATGKEYAYFTLNRPVPSALFHPFLLWFPYPLDVMKMDEACRLLLGTHDFTSFQAARSANRNPVLEVFSARCFRGTGNIHLPFSVLGNEVVTFIIHARNFLHHMVRNIAGTLLEIGESKRAVKGMSEILESRDRRRAGPKAPAKGLFLAKVHYPEVFQ